MAKDKTTNKRQNWEPKCEILIMANWFWSLRRKQI